MVGEEGGSPPPFLPCSKTFFLLCCLGEKRGVPFQAEQGVVQEGPSRALAPVIPTFLSFFLFPFFIFSLIGQHDHSSLKYSPLGLCVSGGWEAQVEIPVNQYSGKAEQSCGGKEAQSTKLIFANNDDKRKMRRCCTSGFHINFAVA